MQRVLKWTGLILLIAHTGVFAAESAPSGQPAGKIEKKTGAAKVKTAKTPTRQRFKGEIVAIDRASHSVTVKGASQEKDFVTQDAAKDSLEILQTGDRVRVTYTEKDGARAATSLARLKAKTKASGKNHKNSANGKVNEKQ